MRDLARQITVRAVNKQIQCKLRDGIHADSQQTVVVYTDNKRGEMTAESRMSQLSQQWYKQHSHNQYWQLWRNRRTQRLGQIAQRACISHAARQSDQPEVTSESDPSAAVKEDSSVVVQQFLSAHAALEQSWCSHWVAVLDRRSDQAMTALESALVVHSAAASRLQEGMQIFDPAVVVSLQISRQQASSELQDSNGQGK